MSRVTLADTLALRKTGTAVMVLSVLVHVTLKHQVVRLKEKEAAVTSRIRLPTVTNVDETCKMPPTRFSVLRVPNSTLRNRDGLRYAGMDVD
ncbi:unnamed protein product [Heligmosomoides polygyrus]|uniref:Secreted protein n=1 Tax=Heligmosomoides polygyrus TaxID=6339 RepID=A0A183G097_HELPZ|nr:unnamed protein product [Heligmosomoides polygyrus]